jgi:hypothetical protein
MLRQVLGCFLILTLVGLGGPVLAAEQTVQAVKSEVFKGWAEGVRITVKMKSGGLLKGRVSGTSSEDFTLAAKGGSRTVSYAEVMEVRKNQELGLIKALAVIGGVVVGVTMLTLMNRD